MPAGDVELWLLAEHAVPSAREALAAGLLSEDERARYARLRTPSGRRQFLGGRILCRHALSARTGVDPSEWRFATGPHGRPGLASEGWRGLDFNLSHTDGLIACVVSEGARCGVDLETTPALPEALAVAAHHFAVTERAELDALPAGRRAERFSALWVLKEAYAKALGVGLTRELSSFAFSLRGPAIALTDAELGAEDARRWRFWLSRAGERHVCAVALDHPAPRLRVLEFGGATYQSPYPGALIGDFVIPAPKIKTETRGQPCTSLRST